MKIQNCIAVPRMMDTTTNTTNSKWTVSLFLLLAGVTIHLYRYVVYLVRDFIYVVQGGDGEQYAGSRWKQLYSNQPDRTIMYMPRGHLPRGHTDTMHHSTGEQRDAETEGNLRKELGLKSVAKHCRLQV